MQSFASEYLQTVIRRVKHYRELGERSFAQISDESFHFSPGEESNSIAVIIQHLSGNMISRWTNFLEEDGEKEWRNRDNEFAQHDYDRQRLLQLWNDGWNCFVKALEGLKEDDLLKTIYIRGEALTVIDAINRQLAHYPYHVGQIVYLARMTCSNNWQSLSIPRGASQQYNAGDGMKDPAKKF